MGGPGHQVLYPTEWRTTDTLGSSCAQRGGIPEPSPYSLTNEVDLTGSKIREVMNIASLTAVPAAMERDGKVDSAVVLLYSSTVGMFQPVAAEWIVLLNGGP